jgi:hypothetical protein
VSAKHVTWISHTVSVGFQGTDDMTSTT